MRRREFLAFTAAAASWPTLAPAQAPGLPIVGFLNGGSSAAFGHLAAAFRDGLKEVGFIDGQNVTIEYRWGEGREDLLRAQGTDLVQRGARVLAIGGPRSLEFKQSFIPSGIPLVETFATDPSGLASIESMARTGTNITGVSVFSVELEAKRFELLRDLLPKAKRFAVLHDQSSLYADLQLKEIEVTARSTGRELHVLKVRTEAEIERAYASLPGTGVQGLIIMATPFFNIKRSLLAALASRHAIPTIHEVREFVEAGGLMSYGPSIPGVYRQLGIYTGRVLRGEKATDLPIVQPSKFNLVINLKTAEALGIEVPPAILARADVVIE